MPQVMDHVRELADVIGPRPACTDAEARAADYIEEAFRARGLEPERHEFDCPRTYSWAHALCHALTLGAAVLSIWASMPALVIGAAAAALLWLDLDTRFTLAKFLGKGPSQNIIARHVPRQRRGERLKRVVIVAHYDSAKSAITSSPGMVRNLPLLLTLTKAATFLTPAVIGFGALPFAQEWRPWTGYAACVTAAYLLFPLVVMVHRELLAHATDGANDNASGVAAMLGVMEATVPEPDEAQLRERPVRRGMRAAYETGVAPDDALLEYRAMPAPGQPAEDVPLDGFGDVDWETGRLEPVRVTPAAQAQPPLSPATTGDWAEDAAVGGLWDEEPPRAAGPKQPVRFEDEVPEGQGSLPLDVYETRPAASEPAHEERERHGHGISAWLGIGKGFDVRKAGKKIGSWENIDSDDDDEEFGFKGGTAGDDARDGETADLAARIRRRVTENVDRALVEKEIWFVATGADEAGGWGIRNLLDTYGEELDDALIINIESVGAGTVAFVTEEGAARRYQADRRLMTQARRTVRESGLSVKGHSYRGFTTSATPALARGARAMSVTALDINGRVPNWHWHSDVADNVSPQTIEQAAAFVTALVRDL
ncbi:MAG: hypothetical protein ACYC6J_04445 [Coriobacteriia bacterium]